MSTLIIIRGNSGSGKTSVAKALQRKLGRNTLLISQDVVRRDMLWGRDGQNTDALPLLLALLHYGQKHCPYVILEGILRADWYLPLFSTAKKLFSLAFLLITMNSLLKKHYAGTPPNPPPRFRRNRNAPLVDRKRLDCNHSGNYFHR